jgi:hypothetical protein
MSEYLIVSRAAIIFWTSLAVVPAEILFDAIETELERRGAERSYRAPCLVLRQVPERKIVGARNDKAHCTVTGSRWIVASS